jgi:hypothetical protein
MSKEDLLLLPYYMNDFIDRMRPVSIEVQVRIFAEQGYIEEGHRGSDKFVPFEMWKILKRNKQLINIKLKQK